MTARRVPRETGQGSRGVTLVLPPDARPGLVRIGDYLPGVEYTVDHDTAARLRARGFQLAAADRGATYPSPEVDAGGGGIPINQRDEE